MGAKIVNAFRLFFICFGVDLGAFRGPKWMTSGAWGGPRSEKAILQKPWFYSIAPRIPPARLCEQSCRWVIESRARGSEEQITARKPRTATPKQKQKLQRQQGQHKRRGGRRRTARTTAAATPKEPREHPEGDFASPGRSLWLPRGCF